jgi:oxygen-dependent protoporphyrinogen oxidase
VSLNADAVVIAASPLVCRALAGPHAPAIIEPLEAIRSTGLGVVHLGFRREHVAHPMDGFGFLLPKSERIPPLLGAIWAGSVFSAHAPPGHVLVRAIIGGTRWPEAMHMREEELVHQTLVAIGPLLGINGSPVVAQTRTWPGTVPVYEPGHLDRITRIAAATSGLPGLWCAGNWIGGLGVNDRVIAARRLAEEIARWLAVRPGRSELAEAST